MEKEITKTTNIVVTEEMKLRGKLDDKIAAIRDELVVVNEEDGYKFKYAGLDVIKKALKNLKEKHKIEYGWDDIQIVTEANIPYKIFTFSIRDKETDYRITKSFPIQDTAVKAGLDTYQTAGAGFTYAERYFLRLLFFIDGVAPEELAVQEFKAILNKLKKCKTMKDVLVIRDTDYKNLQYFNDNVNHKDKATNEETPAYYLWNQILSTGSMLEKGEFTSKISGCKTKTEFKKIYEEFKQHLNFWDAKELGKQFTGFFNQLAE